MRNKLVLVMALSMLIFLHYKSYSQVNVTNHDDFFKDAGASSNTEANVLKVGAFHFWCGELPFFYERKLSDHLSVEVCAGITFRYLEKDLANIITNDSTGVKDPTGLDALHYKIGYVLKADFRYYFDGSMPEGWYISPQVRYKVYNTYYQNILLAPSQNINYTGNSKFYAGFRYLDMMIVAGHQALAWSSDFSVDVYAGIGLRSRSYIQPTAHAYTPTYGITTDYYTFAPKTDAVIYIPFGILFGVAFD